MVAAASAAGRLRADLQSGKSRKPTVERTHASVDLDNDRGRLPEGEKEMLALSPTQREKLIQVHYYHLIQVDRWRNARQLKVVRKASGELSASWDRPAPKIPWERVMCSHEFRIHVRPLDKVKRWVKKYGRKLRKEIAYGTRQGYPAWVVSRVRSARRSQRQRPLCPARPLARSVCPAMHPRVSCDPLVPCALAKPQKQDMDKWTALPPRSEWPEPTSPKPTRERAAEASADSDEHEQAAEDSDESEQEGVPQRGASSGESTTAESASMHKPAGESSQATPASAATSKRKCAATATDGARGAAKCKRAATNQTSTATSTSTGASLDLGSDGDDDDEPLGEQQAVEGRGGVLPTAQGLESIAPSSTSPPKRTRVSWGQLLDEADAKSTDATAGERAAASREEPACMASSSDTPQVDAAVPPGTRKRSRAASDAPKGCAAANSTDETTRAAAGSIATDARERTGDESRTVADPGANASGDRKRPQAMRSSSAQSAGEGSGGAVESPLVPVPGSITAARRQLTPAELAEVADAQGRKGSASEPLGPTYPASSISVRQLCRKDFRRLSADQLKDEEINAFGHLLMKAHPDVLVLSTHFYLKLMERGVYDYRRVRRWKEHLELFSKRLVLLPVHTPRHWTLLVARLSPSQLCGEYYDSCGDDGSHHLDTLRRLLEDAHRSINKTELDISSWSQVSFKSRTPQQRQDEHTEYDGVECGVFMLRTEEYVAGDMRLDFTLSSIKEYERRRLTLELLNGALLSN